LLALPKTESFSQAVEINLFKENKNKARASNPTPQPETIIGVDFSGPFSHAAYKIFTAEKAAIDMNKSIRFIIKGFNGDIEVEKSTANTVIKVKWAFFG
jgi:hypothetical protein